MEATLILNPGRERSILHRHPWIFSGAIQRLQGTPAIGETVVVLSSQGDYLGRAAFSPRSQIQARMWTWNEEQVTPEWLAQQLQSAIQRRKSLFSPTNTALRLVHAESDGLPGLVVDQYSDVLVFQFLSAGVEFWRDDIVRILLNLTGCKDAYERSDVEIRKLEGLPLRTGVLAGTPASEVDILENGFRFRVDIEHGHKTGFYLDQKANRQHFQTYAENRCVLNCFCYTGAFSIYALAGGASQVLSVDSSAEGLARGVEHVAINHLEGRQAEWLEGDVFKVLRQMRDKNRKFDAIILDPPKFASNALQIDKASRAYKDINLLAFKLLNPGGVLFTFSCSGAISQDLFQKIVAGAAVDAGVKVQILEYLFQSPDHPVTLNFPEGLYLKGLALRVI